MIEPIEGSTDAVTPNTTAVVSATALTLPLTKTSHLDQPSSSNLQGRETATAAHPTNTVNVPPVDQPIVVSDLSHINESVI